ncbi:MAG: YbjP/YqhG family protein [Bacteroidia bacterium]|nr:YbjP/YqhG family protein [Bacteroidia bacterium]
MKLFNGLVSAVSILVISFSCVHTQKDTGTNSHAYIQLSTDSLELLALTKNLLKWHEVDTNRDFPLTSDNDSIYERIDWLVQKSRMEELSQTNFFTQEFIDNYMKIALYLDKELNDNQVKYYKGELPPYGNDADEWCNCQDYPSDIWSRLMIKNIKLDNDFATYYWTWGGDFDYLVKAKKEKGRWKITFLERFDIKNYTW